MTFSSTGAFPLESTGFVWNVTSLPSSPLMVVKHSSFYAVMMRTQRPTFVTCGSASFFSVAALACVASLVRSSFTFAAASFTFFLISSLFCF